MPSPRPQPQPERSVPTAQDARWVIRDISKFVRAYDPPIEELPTERQPVAHMLWGWWLWLMEQALLVAEAKRPARVAAVLPLVRSVGEHSDLMLWLHAVGPDGIPALHAAAAHHQQQLWDAYVKETGDKPVGISRPEGPAPPANIAEIEARRHLDTVEQRLGMFEGGAPYYVYRLTSGLVHGGVSTSRVYAPVSPDGSGHVLHEPSPDTVQGLIPAVMLDCGIRCAQAAVVFRDEIQASSGPLETRTQVWLTRLGIDDQLPNLRSPSRRGPSVADVRNAATQLLETDFEAAGQILRNMTVAELPDSRHRAAIVRSIKSLRSASRRLQRVNTEPPQDVD